MYPPGTTGKISYMLNYAKFALFYDEIMGDRTEDIDQVRERITKYLPTATSVLEFGCGTGALLAGLAGDLKLTGIDQSPEMLSYASARNLPHTTLVQADMTKFSLDERFDVAICMFDTLNHLPQFESWLELFERVHEHLVEGGLFIFDVNTLGRLRGLGHQPPYVQDFGGNTLIMNITPGEGDVSIWDVQIFERLGEDDDLFRLHQETILELAVPLKQIAGALAPHFDVLETADLDGGPVSDESSRVLFACRHRA